MLYSVIPEKYGSLLALAGIVFAFAATVFATAKLADLLPKDGEGSLPMTESCQRESQGAQGSFSSSPLRWRRFSLRP